MNYNFYIIKKDIMSYYIGSTCNVTSPMETRVQSRAADRNIKSKEGKKEEKRRANIRD